METAAGDVSSEGESRERTVELESFWRSVQRAGEGWRTEGSWEYVSGLEKDPQRRNRGEEKGKAASSRGGADAPEKKKSKKQNKQTNTLGDLGFDF